MLLIMVCTFAVMVLVVADLKRQRGRERLRITPMGELIF
jgi:hypothetical protein